MGGSRPDNSSQMAQIQANRESMKFIKQQSDIARGDLMKLFPQAIESQRQGFQSGLDVLQEGFPQQQQQFQDGNVASQQALIDAQGGIEAALLGGVAAPPGTGPTSPFVGELTKFSPQTLGDAPAGVRDPRPSSVGPTPEQIAQLLAAGGAR